MTGGDDGEGHLIVRLDTGETFVSPDGWPLLSPPKPGETLAAFWDRAIVEDPFLQTITARTSRGQSVPPLDGKRPEGLTLAWWHKTWPYRVFSRYFDEPPRNYHRDRVYWRLGVEAVARWTAGDLVVKGRRVDVPESQVEPVKPGLLRNPFMVLRPHAQGGGWFGPEKWQGREPPPGLPQYCDLTVWPPEPRQAKRKKTKREQIADALVSLHGAGTDILSPVVSVDELHTKAKMEAKVEISSKANFEKALKDARKRCLEA